MCICPQPVRVTNICGQGKKKKDPFQIAREVLSCSTFCGQDEKCHLELRLPNSSLGVTQEGDECGAQGVLLIVVLGAVGVRQLDQAVIVRQVGVGLAETPRTSRDE